MAIETNDILKKRVRLNRRNYGSDKIVNSVPFNDVVRSMRKGERNKEMFLKWRDGQSQASLAREYGINAASAHEAITKMTRLYNAVMIRNYDAIRKACNVRKLSGTEKLILEVGGPDGKRVANALSRYLSWIDTEEDLKDFIKFGTRFDFLEIRNLGKKSVDILLRVQEKLWGAKPGKLLPKEYYDNLTLRNDITYGIESYGRKEALSYSPIKKFMAYLRKEGIITRNEFIYIGPKVFFDNAFPFNIDRVCKAYKYCLNLPIPSEERYFSICVVNENNPGEMNVIPKLTKEEVDAWFSAQSASEKICRSGIYRDSNIVIALRGPKKEGD